MPCSLVVEALYLKKYRVRWMVSPAFGTCGARTASAAIMMFLVIPKSILVTYNLPFKPLNFIFGNNLLCACKALQQI